MVLSHFSQDLDNQDADLEVVHLGKKGKPHKHKKKKKRFVSVASISEPEAFHNDHEGDQVGPVIEIPPLDDVKLFSAILNSQNNNDPEFSGGGDSSDKFITPRTRSPGDGMEISEDKVDGTVPNVKDTTKDNVNDSDIDATKVSQNKADFNALSDSENDRFDAKQSDKEGTSKAESAVKSGTFTDMIKARVSSIVTAGELIENDEHNEEKTSTKPNAKETTKSIFDYSFEADKSDMYLENILNDESETTQTIIDTTNDFSKVTKPVSEVPSIYSTQNAYTSSDDDDDTEYFRRDLSQDRTTSARSTPSLKSNASVSKFQESSDNLDKVSVSSGKGLSGNDRRIVSPYSDSDSKHSELFSSNQNRSKSVMSYSSANETEDEFSASQKSHNNRRESRYSANETTIYRNSPALSVDTHSSNQSPSTDLESKF